MKRQKTYIDRENMLKSGKYFQVSTCSVPYTNNVCNLVKATDAQLVALLRKSISSEKNIFSEMEKLAKKLEKSMILTKNIQEALAIKRAENTKNKWLNDGKQLYRSNTRYKETFQIKKKEVEIQHVITTQGGERKKTVYLETKNFSTTEEAEKYIKEHSGDFDILFSDENPPVFGVHRKYFEYGGELLPGCRLANED